MEKDTIGSKMRNKLTPFLNMIKLLDEIQSSINVGVPTVLDREMLVNFLLEHRESFWNSFKSLEKISKMPIVDQTIIED